MGRSLRLLAVLALGVALATGITATATAMPPPATTQNQSDPSPSPLIEEAWRGRTVVELFRSGERNFVPDPEIVGDPVAPPQARPAPVPHRPVPPAPWPGVGMLASLLLGLVGGVVGGAAALAGWTATSRRRQPASAT